MQFIDLQKQQKEIRKCVYMLIFHNTWSLYQNKVNFELTIKVNREGNECNLGWKKEIKGLDMNIFFLLKIQAEAITKNTWKNKNESI